MGIDVSDNKEVSFSDAHESRVDTSLANNPQKCRTARGLTVHSIYRRMVTRTPMVGDGNPLIYALKSKSGYTITVDEICKFSPSFKAIVDKTMSAREDLVFVPVPSSHKVVSYFTKRVARRSANSTILDDLFVKKNCAEVYADLQQVVFPAKIKNDGVTLLRSLERSPGKIFSMKDVVEPKLRRYINPLKLVGTLPAGNREIILVDDLMSTGSTFDSAYALLKEAGISSGVEGLSLLSKL